MKETLEISITSRYANIDSVSSAARSFVKRMGFDEDTTGWVELAVREALINAIRHGNKEDSEKKVEIKFIAKDEVFTALIRDHGNGFDPDSLPSPVDPQNLLNPTGRGIFLMRSLMDDVRYSRHPEGGMVVHITKRVPELKGNPRRKK